MLDSLMIHLISSVHLIVFSLLYFFLDDLQNTNFRKIGFICLVLPISIFINRFVTIFAFLALLLAVLIFSYLNSKDLSYSMLLVSFSGFCEILLSKIISRIFYFYLSSSNLELNYFLFLLVILLLIAVTKIAIIVFNKIMNGVNHSMWKHTVSFVSLMLILGYQICVLVLYYSNSPITSLMIILVYLGFGAFLYVISGLIKKEMQLEESIYNSDSEKALVKQYSKILSKENEDIRKFKHDYINLLSSFEYFLATENYEALNNYYFNHLSQTKRLVRTHSIGLSMLDNIESIELKSLLVVKIMEATSSNIEMKIEVEKNIPKPESDLINLIRIIGIVFDNAIEELQVSGSGVIDIALFKKETRVYFIIQNPLKLDLDKNELYKKKGLSTKGKNRGIGLKNILELSAMSKTICVETRTENRKFVQIISFEGG